ncbi:DUF4011 domain-containing protein [Nitratireductor alexandrii]|uniref:DUF4011 domain-containing protein n=1 Tax=Nitratireductor alexandrii TaxID=2448161 RepID=UPI000FDCD775|nr:DUF4011 domain-containing protein [Nitratireductor alexandrii]
MEQLERELVLEMNGGSLVMATPEDAVDKAGEISQLVNEKIEDLRLRLLDLTARNPLIRVRLSHASNSYVRVVDELPDVLFFRLSESRAMQFAPLPPLEEDPPDEQTRDFLDAVSLARATDETYRASLDKLDPNGTDYLDKSRKLERALKDRVRELAGLPPRPTSKDIASLATHARAHGITPAFDLPDPDEEREDGRHTDDEIQTLQLPRDLERRLNSIISKGNTWQQETGVNVVQAAFGFLEWSDPNGRDNNLSPLIVLPVVLKSQKTPGGAKFSVVGAGENAESNGVLAERLKRDFGLKLPDYDGGSTEEYFELIDKLKPNIPTWKVRRQVVFGIFPSARIAMYHDLDTTAADFANNDIVRAIMAGTQTSGLSPYAKDHDVDAADNEGRSPLMVMDADSSQVSTILDVASGKNIAVEGPPGTGKSQTIVNVIAAALAEGKKVLFVAEKLAALDVVRSRLETVGLGEFILPLQASRSSRKEVVASLRDRLTMGSAQRPRDFDTKHRRLRDTRSKLGEYVEILSSIFAGTGRTVFEILGKAIATGPAVADLSREIRDLSLVPHGEYDDATLQGILDRARAFDAALAAASTTPDFWRGTHLVSLTPIEADEILETTIGAASRAARAGQCRKRCQEFGIVLPESLARQKDHAVAIKDFLTTVDVDQLVEWAHLVAADDIEPMRRITASAENTAELTVRLSAQLVDLRTRDAVERALEICQLHGLGSPDPAALASKTEKLARTLQAVSSVRRRIADFQEHCAGSAGWTLRMFHVARKLVIDAGRDVLHLRTAELASPAALPALKALVARGKELADDKEKLSAMFFLEGTVSRETVRGALAAIKGMGALSFLSTDARSAKKFYMENSRNNRFDKEQSIRELTSLADFVDRESDFKNDSRCKDLFGLNFSGLSTDFVQYEKLVGFLENVDASFPGPEHQQIRAFIKTADTELLLSLPDVGSLDQDITPSELDQMMDRERAKVDQSGKILEELRSAAAAFCNPASMAVRDMERLLADLGALNEHREAISADCQILGIQSGNGVGSSTFSTLEQWIALKEVVGGDRQLAEALGAAASSGNLPRIGQALGDLVEELKALERAVADVTQKTGVDLEGLMGKPVGLESWLSGASVDRTGLLAHSDVRRARTAVERDGFGWIAERQLSRELDRSTAEIVEAVVARFQASRVYDQHGEALSGYTGEKLSELRRRLAELDRQLIALSRNKLRAELYDVADPPPGNGVGRKADYTDMALIWSEIEKKKRFISVRDLVRRAADAVLELKPCWMMSPQAVAQFVPKGKVQFDLCIIDEASQMPPEDAIGALFRSSQTMIVGDTNQLPPTSFFQKMLDDEVDDDEKETVLQESVLEMAKSTYRPARRLRWHYRSRHSGLIKFSNRLIYDDDLIVFPSPDEIRPDMGVSLQQVGGSYKSGLNADEAQAVMEAVVRFMREHPDRSLGVVAVNKQQADHLRELFDNDFLPEHAHVRRYVEQWEEKRDGLESFFIKNLENVQGDERDVIFISTVYGPGKPGDAVAQRFGPINGIAGQRRLNVLFSRAKLRIVTFSSMSSADIRAEENGNKGAWMLKRWLEYSATGILESGDITDREPDSDFERHVIEQIRSMGCEPVAQVGVAGYFIDIGVKHPNWPHGYLLGVECDGAAYHSSRSARDRDRLRQEVLEQLGWKLVRIWSTDWFADPRREAAVLRQSITNRLEQLKSSTKTIELAGKPDIGSLNREEPAGKAEIEFELTPRPEPARTNRAIQQHFDLSPTKPVAEQPLVGRSDRIEIGDTVRLRYLTHGQDVIQVTISKHGNDPEKGLVGHAMPLAEAVLDAQEGDEIEVLNGSYLRSAVIEKVIKAKATA